MALIKIMRASSYTEGIDASVSRSAENLSQE